jgi:hypothetical protein
MKVCSGAEAWLHFFTSVLCGTLVVSLMLLLLYPMAKPTVATKEENERTSKLVSTL